MDKLLNANCEKVYQDLLGVTIAHSFMNKLFVEAPSKDFIENLKVTHILDSDWPMCESLESVTGLGLLKKYFSTYTESSFGELTDNYNVLFIGPGPLLAAPWESVYTETDKTLFGKSTLDVREMYRKNGLQINKLHKEPDDHISYECAYINFLSLKAVEAFESEEKEKCCDLIEDMRLFYGLHMKKWVVEFADRVIENSATDFYKGAGWLLKGMIKETSALLNNMEN
ncbi:hypothetical protein EP073_03965 [Geovibrio thiophilus]|uniref:Molecular chaperone TorD n=1 Tax=Geovibrio thiophilus TaxID=139438 RepID=A0A3R5XW74_9BACT|nr:molecular chaperone TorD family protein [Geovibrio thiophilus]QAR32590.1 hypothetical protein EP073_03965 [Geovibrio thiophilus]